MIVNRQFSENNSALDARLDELAAVTAELLAEAVDQGIKTAPTNLEKHRFSACNSADRE